MGVCRSWFVLLGLNMSYGVLVGLGRFQRVLVGLGMSRLVSEDPGGFWWISAGLGGSPANNSCLYGILIGFSKNFCEI